MPTRLCLQAGCPNESHYRGRCAEHARSNDRNIRRAGRRIYNTAKWRHTRERVLSEQPLCATEGCDTISTDVHHIVDLDDGGDPWARSNLEALCLACHSRITRSEQLSTGG